MLANLYNLVSGLFIMLVLIPLVCLWWAVVALVELFVRLAWRFFWWALATLAEWLARRDSFFK